MTHIIAPRSGVAFELRAGQSLKVIDPEGEQVADLLAFHRHDTGEVLSCARSIDYAGKIYFTRGDSLYSNRSRVMLDITADTTGRHDVLMPPCSPEMFRRLYGDENPPPGCFGNLARALAPYGIAPDAIPVTFNVFMHVALDGRTGKTRVLPPLSKPGDFIIFKARMDLLVGLTACSAPHSNNRACTAIHYDILPRDGQD